MVFALAVHALLILMLIVVAPRSEDLFSPSAPLVVDLIAAELKADSSSRKAEKQPERNSRAAPKQAVREREKPVPAEAASPPAPKMPPIELLELTRQELASVGATMGSRRAANGAGSQTGSSGAAEGSQSEAGEGPGGAQLHDVDWYRKPTRAELAPYLPASVKQSGWGMIACKMVEDYRVEDCRELGQSPRGSGFSRAVRQAAWQFRVRPPRLGGNPLLGTWVRIRIDYTEGVPD